MFGSIATCTILKDLAIGSNAVRHALHGKLLLTNKFLVAAVAVEIGGDDFGAGVPELFDRAEL